MRLVPNTYSATLARLKEESVEKSAVTAQGAHYDRTQRGNPPVNSPDTKNYGAAWTRERDHPSTAGALLPPSGRGVSGEAVELNLSPAARAIYSHDPEAINIPANAIPNKDGSLALELILKWAVSTGLIERAPKIVLYGSDGRDALDTYIGKVSALAGDGDDELTVGANSTLLGGAGNDFLRTLWESTIDGGDGDDYIEAWQHSTLSGGAGDDSINGFLSFTIASGGEGNDTLEGSNFSELDGGDGNDLITAYEGSTLSGGDGADFMTAGSDSTLDGGSGADYLSAHHRSKLTGGDGNDILTAEQSSTLDGGAGDDFLRAAEMSTLVGGAGNDELWARDYSVLDGGSGNDVLRGLRASTLTGGEGNDTLSAYDHSTLDGGAGNDILDAAMDSTVIGGTGDDTLFVSTGTVVRFAKGDGHDVVQLNGEAPDETFASKTLRFSRIAARDLSFERHGDDLRVRIGDGSDSVTLRNVAKAGLPKFTFTDGSMVTLPDFAAMADKQA